MTRRGRTVPSLTVRVSHEATRLSQTHVAAAFEQLVPVLERQTRAPRAEADKHDTDAACGGAKSVTDPIAKRYVTNSAMPRTGARSR
jgi:hypothetical protein